MPIYRLSAAQEQGLHLGNTRSEAITFGTSPDFLAFIAQAVVKGKFQITRQTSGVSEITPPHWIHNNMRYFISSRTPDSAIFQTIPRSLTSTITRVVADGSVNASAVSGVHSIQIPEETPFAPILGPREDGRPDYYCHEIVMGHVEGLEGYHRQAAAIIQQAE